MFSKIKTFRKSKIIQLTPTKHERSESEKSSRPSSRLYSAPQQLFGIAKFSQDMTTLVNNAYGSDIQFKVGGGERSTLQESGETTYDESTTETLYAHSLILRCRSRYFATMLSGDKNWKESTKGIIYKPNISPDTFRDVLKYIYTGNVPTTNSENLIELIAAADEMELEELGTECQIQLLRKIENILLGRCDSEEEGENEETLEGSIKQRNSLEMAIRTHIIPALKLANSPSLSDLSQKLITVIIPHMPMIIENHDAYNIFIEKISSEDLVKIIASDNLAMPERSIWDLALNWACRQVNLSKGSVEVRLSKAEDMEDDNKELNELKTALAPILPAIRFSLLHPDEYAQMINYLSFFLPRYRSSELNRYFINHNSTKRLDEPRNPVSSK